MGRTLSVALPDLKPTEEFLQVVGGHGPAYDGWRSISSRPRCRIEGGTVGRQISHRRVMVANTGRANRCRISTDRQESARFEQGDQFPERPGPVGRRGVHLDGGLPATRRHGLLPAPMSRTIACLKRSRFVVPVR